MIIKLNTAKIYIINLNIYMRNIVKTKGSKRKWGIPLSETLKMLKWDVQPLTEEEKKKIHKVAEYKNKDNLILRMWI